MLQTAPGLQVVWQPPGMPLQSTLQVVLAAQLVLQPPAGQANEQGLAGVLQASSQVPTASGSGLAAQVQLEPVQEQVGPEEDGAEHITPVAPPLAPPA
jgi:hypothetical protein